MLLWTFVKINRHIWLYTENIMYQKQHIVHWKHRCRVGASNTRAACGPGRDFVRPAMLFGNLQIINIYVAKCLEMRCREIIESNLNDTQCGFVPAVVIQTAFRSPAKFWEHAKDVFTALWTSRKHTTWFLVKNFGELWVSTVLTAASYWPSSHYIPAHKLVSVSGELNHDLSPLV